MPIGAFKLNGIGRYLAAEGPVSTARAKPAILGTQQTATLSTTGGQFNGYVQWDQDEFFDVTVDPTDTTWYFNTGKAWTIEWWWMRTSTLSLTTSDYFNISGISSTNLSIQTHASTANNYNFYVGGSVRYTAAVPTTMTHYAIVSTGSNTIELFVNGSRVSSTALTQTPNTRQFSWTVPGFGATPKLRFDEMRISNSARYSGTTYTVPSAAFTNDANTLGIFHFDSSTIVDDFTPTTTVTPTYGITFGTTSASGYYADTSITEAITSSNAGVTIAFWAYPTKANHSGSEWWNFMLTNTDGGNASALVSIKDNGDLRFYRQLAPGFQDFSSLVSNAFPTANQWYHVAMAFNSTTQVIQVYIDGVAKTTSGTLSTTNSRWDILNGIYVGGTGGTRDGRADKMAQLWADNSFVDLSTNISKFYNNGYVNMGPNGTFSGLSQPLFYHDGNTTTGWNNSFPTKGGRTSGQYITYNLLDNDTGTITNA